ncbi:predicted protein [Thalassiosira pseudonana CCMP1335]|uniref:Nudix hydrolase domain-containing protein n=1 Tax=Thalassiosira pseudonana TaxID=35128 RepID=B8BV14_THAPS|nr:predicted protein [Thalassiosira pseudonana CCMP1335]EED94857.1 predicted protein [Thalassiosira pseudonana CCMP1335]
MAASRFVLQQRRLLHPGIITFAATIAVIQSSSCASAYFLPSLTSHHRQRHRHCHQQLMSASSDATTGNEGNSFIDKLALILINSDNKQLVARSYGKPVFYTPGGKREAGETDEEALVRECKEEISVDLKSSTKVAARIEPYGVFQAQAFGKPEGTMVRMTCFRVLPREAELELEKLVQPSAEVEELQWINSTFDNKMLTVTGIMIVDDLKKRGLID